MLVMMGCTMLVTAPVMAVGGIIMAITRAPSLSWLIGVSVPVLLVAGSSCKHTNLSRNIFRKN